MTPNEYSNDEPVTVWIEQLREADDEAAAKLWRHFVNELQRSARNKLNPETRRVYDEEDAAQSAFHSVCAGIGQGRFPDLNDRNGFWRLLLTITARKVAHRHRHDQQQRRDTRRNLSDAIFKSATEDSAHGGIDRLPAREPTPEFAAEFVETCDTLFACLEDRDLHDVAKLRMEGYTDGEIGERLACSRRTVQRRLELIRRQWQRLGATGEVSQ